MTHKTLGLLFRLLVFAVAFLIGLFFIIRLNEWAGAFRYNLFFTGNYEFLVYVLIFVFAVGYVIRWLIKKEFHAEFVAKRRPKA